MTTRLPQYVIEFDHDKERIFRSDGAAMTIKERDHLIQLIKNSYREQVVDHLVREIDNMGERAEWFFPMSNKDLYGQRCGVYFVEDESRPGLIKIGYTEKSLLSRVSSLRFDNWCIKPTIYAFAKMPDCIDFEKALHNKFQYINHDREWYESPSIIDYLQGFRGLQ